MNLRPNSAIPEEVLYVRIIPYKSEVADAPIVDWDRKASGQTSITRDLVEQEAPLAIIPKEYEKV